MDLAYTIIESPLSQRLVAAVAQNLSAAPAHGLWLLLSTSALAIWTLRQTRA